MLYTSNGCSAILHSDATAYSLGFCRIVIFGTWFVLLCPAPINVLSCFPMELFEGFGIFRMVPTAVYETLFTETILTVFKGSLLFLSALLCLGCRPYTLLGICFGLMVLLFDAVTKSFGSYSNHAQLSLMYVTWIIVLFPASDRMSIFPAKALRLGAMYAVPMLAMSFALALPYALIGVRRIFVGGLEIFTGDSILRYSAVYSLKYNSYGFDWGLLALTQPILGTLMKIGFAVITIAEVLTPFCLFYPRLRLAWLIIMVPFHFISLFTLNIFFVENLVLIAVLFTSLSHRFAPHPGKIKDLPIVFYDGACGLCSRFIRFLLLLDREKILHFAPLQGTTSASERFKQARNPGEWSVMYRDENGIYDSSTAILRAVSRIGGVWTLAGVALIVPVAIRDAVYRFVAKYRRRGGRSTDSCPTRKLTDAGRFLA